QQPHHRRRREPLPRSAVRPHRKAPVRASRRHLALRNRRRRIAAVHPMYSLDTSVFMDWQARYYPLDVFQSLEAKIDALIAAGDATAVQLVREEIDAVGPPGLQTWAK